MAGKTSKVFCYVGPEKSASGIQEPELFFPRFRKLTNS